MSNMSYCRFQNTLGDLRDCYDAMEEAVEEHGNPLAGLSREELYAAKRLLQLCNDIDNNYGEVMAEEDISHERMANELRRAQLGTNKPYQPICLDCGAEGQTKGHQDCQYPGRY